MSEPTGIVGNQQRFPLLIPLTKMYVCTVSVDVSYMCCKGFVTVSLTRH